MFRIVLAGLGISGLLFARRRRLDFSNPLLWVWTLYWGWLFGSVVWSSNPSFTAYKLTVLAMFGLAAIGIPKWYSLFDWTLVLSVTCCWFFLIGLSAELLHGQFQPWTSDYRFVGTKHPNSIAAYGFACCLFAITHFGRGSVRTNARCIAIGLAGCVFLLLTKSRTSLFAAIVGAGAVTMLRLPSTKRLLFGLASACLLSLAVVGYALLSSAAQGAIGDVAAMGRSEDMSTLTGRLPLWELLLEHVAKRPWVGHGYLGFWDADRVERLGDALQWEIPHGHNMYIDLLLDGGVIGLTLYIAFLLTGLGVAARAFAKGNDSAPFVFGLICAVLIHGGGESLFKHPSFCGFMLYSSVLRLLWKERTPRDLARPLVSDGDDGRVKESPLRKRHDLREEG